MPGLGAVVKEGGSSHFNLAVSTCLTDASSLFNQMAVAPKTKKTEPAMDH
jgi:hypothetical protein